MKKIIYTVTAPVKSITGEITMTEEMTTDEIKLAILKDSGINLSVKLVEEKSLIMDEVVETKSAETNNSLTDNDFKMFEDLEDLEVEVKSEVNNTQHNKDYSENSYDPYYVGRIVWQTYQDENGDIRAGGRSIVEILPNGKLVIKAGLGKNNITTTVPRDRVFLSQHKCLQWIENRTSQYRQK